MPPFAPPKTRALQTWTRFWQRYSGELPASLNTYNDKVAPATRNLIKEIGKDGPVPKSLLGKLPPLGEASAGGEVGAGELARGAGRKFVAVPAALGTLFGFVVFWALYHGWKHTFGAVFEALADVGIDFDHWFVHIHIKPFRFLRAFNRRLLNHLAQEQQIMERAFVWCVNQFLEPVILIVGTILAIGYALWYGLRAAEHALAHRLPKTITHTIVKPVVKTVQRIEVQTKTRVRVIEHTIERVRVRVDYITKAALVTIKQVRLRVGRLETRLKRDERRITHLEKKISVAGFAGLLFAVLAKVGLKWLVCRQVGDFGRNICRMPSHWAKDVLGLLTDFVVLSNICAVIPWVEDAASLVATPLVEGLTAVGAGLCDGNRNPARLVGPLATLPPVTFVPADLAV